MKYYGWLTLNGQVCRGLRPRLKPPVITVSKSTRSMSPDKDYIAIVHEYVEEGENNLDDIQKASNLF